MCHSPLELFKKNTYMQPKKCVNNWCSLKDNSFTKKALIFSNMSLAMVQKTYVSFSACCLFFSAPEKQRSFKVSTSAVTRQTLRLGRWSWMNRWWEWQNSGKHVVSACFFKYFLGIHPEMEVVYGGRTSQRVFFLQIMKYIRYAYHI